MDWRNLESAETLLEAFRRVCRPGSPDINAAVEYIYNCRLDAGRLSEAQRQTIKATVSAFLNQPKSWSELLPVCVLLASAVGKYADQAYGCQALKMAFDMSTERQARNQLLFTINSLAFKYGVATGFDLGDMFFAQVEDWFRFIRPPQFEPEPGRCLIAMPQFLAPPHAPTVDAIAKFRLLRDRFGFDAAILNTAERPAAFDLPLLDVSPANRVKDYANFQNFSDGYGVDNLRLFTPPTPMPSYEGYLAILDFVEKWRPEFILNYGGLHLAGELLARGVKTITMPAGTELLPTRASACDVVFHPLGDGDRAMIARYGMEQVKVIEAVYNYDMPARTRSYVRADFGLEDGDFAIAVVGVRLDFELTGPNIDMLAGVAALDPRIRIVFAGRTSERTQALLAEKIAAEQLRFPGMVEDVPAMYELMDLYVNPRRRGGGSSAAFALGKDLPALTLNHGHIADLTHPDFVFADAGALTAAVRGALDAGTLARMRETARAGFARIGSRERMVEHILTEAGVLPRPQSHA